LSGFPNVITIHGNMQLIAKVSRAKPFSYLWVSAQLERRTIPRTDGVVCISRHTRDAVRDLGRKTWVVPNAVEEEFLDLKRRPDSRPIIVCIGNILLLKNQNAFIRALDPLARQTQFEVVFIGGALSSNHYALEFREL